MVAFANQVAFHPWPLALRVPMMYVTHPRNSFDTQTVFFGGTGIEAVIRTIALVAL